MAIGHTSGPRVPRRATARVAPTRYGGGITSMGRDVLDKSALRVDYEFYNQDR